MTNKAPIQLTVKEAIEQGYTRYCQESSEGCWKLKDVKNLPTNKDPFYLVNKDPTYLTMRPEELYEDLVENFAISRDADDDDGRIGDAIVEAVDWNEIAAKITDNLKKCPIYYPTKIKLVHDTKTNT